MTSLAASLAARIRRSPPGAFDRIIAALTPLERAALWYSWQLWARPEQLPPPGDWSTWLILAGRGFGKTRSVAEFVRAEVEAGRARRVALVARTAADVRDVLVEGESGILAVSPPWCRPNFEPSKRRLTWPNGAIATCYSAEEPDLLRGPQHDLGVADELAAWPRQRETWDQLQMTMRLGVPRVAVSTTPRPQVLLREIVADSDVVVTRGPTSANRSNLSAKYLRSLRRFEGTEQGRQELGGELLDDREGAMFSGSWIQRAPRAPELRRVVVGIDPAVSTSKDSDETGILVVGAGWDEKAYVLEDLSAKLSPDGWATAAIKAFDDHDADAIIIETNRGGDMVKDAITTRLRGRNVPIIEVHASRGKATRAEPVAALYEQRRVVHVGAADRFEKLERQMVEWDPTQRVSPDRVDALVWAVTDLALGPQVSLDGYAEANEELSTVQRPRLPGEMTDRPYHEEDFEQPVGPSGWGGTLG